MSLCHGQVCVWCGCVYGCVGVVCLCVYIKVELWEMKDSSDAQWCVDWITLSISTTLGTL